MHLVKGRLPKFQFSLNCGRSAFFERARSSPSGGLAGCEEGRLQQPESRGERGQHLFGAFQGRGMHHVGRLAVELVAQLCHAAAQRLQEIVHLFERRDWRCTEKIRDSKDELEKRSLIFWPMLDSQGRFTQTACSDLSNLRVQ